MDCFAGGTEEDESFDAGAGEVEGVSCLGWEVEGGGDGGVVGGFAGDEEGWYGDAGRGVSLWS